MRIRSVLVSLSLALGLGASVCAQVQEFHLGPDRRWSQVESPEPGSDGYIIAEARRLLAEDRPNEAFRILSDWISEHEHENNPWLAQAHLLRGDARLAQGREFKALYDYERVLKGYWGTEAFPVAIQRELEIARAYARGKKIRILGFRISDGGEIAVELLIRIQEREPGSDVAEQAGIELADYYYRKRDLKLAHDAYDLYLRNYPRGEHRLRALQRLIQTDLARFKGPRYDSSGLLDARVRIEDFLERFPSEADRTGINEALIVRIDESLGAQLLDTAQWYLGRGDLPSARFVLERLLRNHPQTIAARRAQEIVTQRGWAISEPQPSELRPDSDVIELDAREPSSEDEEDQ